MSIFYGISILLFNILQFLYMPTLVPLRYVPKGLSRKDKKKQIKDLLKSRRMYKKGKYYTRKKVGYPVVKSKHLANVRKIYGQDVSLDMKIGCSSDALKKIVRKGEGAYYSSGSRPNQTPQSWGLARLASAVTGGKAAVVDYRILEEGCPGSKPLRLALKARQKKYKTQKIVIK
jgi:hypothetical protein